MSRPLTTRSHRGELTARLAELPYLLAERPHTVAELAQHFDVNEKTIRRTLDALSLHNHITEERDGRSIRYRYPDGYKFTPPALMPTELALLLLAQESIAQTGLTAFGSPFAAHARSLLNKVRFSLPEPLREQLDLLARVYGSAAIPAKDFSAHAATIERLTSAILERLAVRLNYYTLNRDRTAERTVEPYVLYFDPDGATLKLIGFDRKRRQIIPFSIDHIRRLKLTREHFTRPADFDLRDYLTEHCFNGIHGEPLDVTLRARGVTARVFAERTFHPSQQTVGRTTTKATGASDGEETTTIRLRVARGRGLVRFVMSWSPDVEVLAPEELRREVAEAHRQSLALLSTETHEGATRKATNYRRRVKSSAKK